MRNINRIVCSILLVSACSAEAYDGVCSQRVNKLICKEGSVERIEHTGSVMLKGTNVLGITKVTGPLKAIDAKLQKVMITGSTNFEEVNIADSVEITGKANIHDSTFNGEMQITGNVDSSHDTFNNNLQITGALHAEGTNFNGNLAITSKEVSLSEVTAKDITINIGEQPNIRPSVFLRDNTKVNGSINFTSGNGVVYVTNGSSIAGNVAGGEVFHSE